MRGSPSWIQTVYHVRPHEGIGMSPQERFTHGSTQVRPLDPHLDLERLLYAELLRVVRKDGTVRLNNALYEVDLALRGLEVRLRFDPLSLARVEVDYRRQSFGLAPTRSTSAQQPTRSRTATMKSEAQTLALSSPMGRHRRALRPGQRERLARNSRCPTGPGLSAPNRRLTLGAAAERP